MCRSTFVVLNSLWATYIGVTVKGGALMLRMKYDYVPEGQLFEPCMGTTASSSFLKTLPSGNRATSINLDGGPIMRYLNGSAFLPRRY